jgi:hypothetical protein
MWIIYIVTLVIYNKNILKKTPFMAIGGGSTIPHLAKGVARPPPPFFIFYFYIFYCKCHVSQYDLCRRGLMWQSNDFR